MTKSYQDRKIGIYFYDQEVIQKLVVGKRFVMAEGALKIGSGVITSIIGIGENPHK